VNYLTSGLLTPGNVEAVVKLMYLALTSISVSAQLSAHTSTIISALAASSHSFGMWITNSVKTAQLELTTHIQPIAVSPAQPTCHFGMENIV
jgi:hypothetical protein